MTRHYTLTQDLDRLAWRARLLDEVEAGDELVVSIDGELTFTQQRQLITCLNAVAWARGARVRYAADKTSRKPPLSISYSRPPSITPPKLC